MKQDYILGTEQKKTAGAFLIYAKTGVGKSGSLVTCPGRVIAINAEDKDLGHVIEQIPEKKFQSVRIVGFDNFDGYEEFLNDLHAEYRAGKHQYDVLFFDGLTFLQSNFKLDFEDSRFDLSFAADKRKNTIADRFRIESADWGGLASAMIRISRLLVSFTHFDVTVIATAQETAYPKWNSDIEAAPAFVGKGYPEVMPGFWHYIGHAIPGPRPIHGFYPPIIRFVPDGTFLGRSSSVKLNEKLLTTNGFAPLDWSKILKVIEG